MRPIHALAAAAFSACLIGGAHGALAQGAKHFARTDANGDGKISLSEFIAARGRIFERIDANHDGVITPDEIAAAGHAAENAEAGRMIRSGKEGGGEGGHQLARLQKMAEHGPVTRQMWDQLMTHRFEKLDVGHVGFITMEQMKPHREPTNEAAPTGVDMAAPMAPTAPHG